MTTYKYWVSGITCHMYSREESTRLTGEINYMSAFIPGAERYFRRSLHVKNCRDRFIISSGFQEKGGCPLLRACSVITSNTVLTITYYLGPCLHLEHRPCTTSLQRLLSWAILSSWFQLSPVCMMFVSMSCRHVKNASNHSLHRQRTTNKSTTPTV